MTSSHIVMQTVNHDMNCTHVVMKHVSGDMRFYIFDMNVVHGVMKHVSGDMRFCILDMIEMQRRQCVSQFYTKQPTLESTHLHPPAVVPIKGAEMVDGMGRWQV